MLYAVYRYALTRFVFLTHSIIPYITLPSAIYMNLVSKGSQLVIQFSALSLLSDFLISYSYFRMYKDVRAAVDLCHRDGTLKQMVAKDPKR